MKSKTTVKRSKKKVKRSKKKVKRSKKKPLTDAERIAQYPVLDVKELQRKWEQVEKADKEFEESVINKRFERIVLKGEEPNEAEKLDEVLEDIMIEHNKK
jgi:hypothetical protein